MRADQVDWSVIKGAIIFLVLSVIVCAGLFYAGTHFSELAVREYNQERSKLLSVRGEYQTIDDEKRIIETYLPKYEALEEDGIIGIEKRLSWVETLGDAAETIKLPALRYELRPREEYKPEFPLQQGTYQVFSSDMSLDVGLLHEGDLAALLRELNRNAVGLFSVSRCFLSGPPTTVQLDPKAKNVTARCDLRWFTIGRSEEDAT